MSKTNRWYSHAQSVISEEIAAGKQAGEAVEQIRKRVDAAYPFGPRQYWPYKEWLTARRELFSLHGLRTEAEIAKERARKPAELTVDPTWEAARRDGLIL